MRIVLATLSLLFVVAAANCGRDLDPFREPSEVVASIREAVIAGDGSQLQALELELQFALTLHDTIPDPIFDDLLLILSTSEAHTLDGSGFCWRKAMITG